MKNLLPIYLLVFLFSCNTEKTDTTVLSNHPNVILIMTDDQGWGDLSIHGNDSIQTPNLDQLSKEGVSFDRFYVSPLCAPTRASLLTGRYHLRTGTSWVTHRKEVMRSSEVTIAESLKKAGYHTGIFGKWHNGEQYPNNPEGQGFDEFLGFTAGHWNNYHNPNLFHNDEVVKKEGYINDIFTDAAIDWMKEKEEPFFCYIPYNTPHSPFQVPEKYFKKYKAMGLNDRNASVHGMCENIDDNVGKVLKMLDETNKAEQTIVIFLTDNGPNGRRYNGDMRGTKGSIHEGGMRVPLFMKWGNNFEAGKVIKPITSHMDLLPTILDLCNVPHDKTVQLDGKSLVSLINEIPKWPDRQFYHIQANGELTILNSSLRNEEHRFVLTRDSIMMLFDMQKDPGQKVNIIDQHPDLKQKYLADLKQWFADVTSEGISPPPIPVGYKANGLSHLPAPESKLLGTMKFKGKMGWANDYIINWTSVNDIASWDIEIDKAGDYDIAIEYACKESEIGSSFSISIGDQKRNGKIEQAHYPEFYPSPDYVKRGEVYERDWKTLNIGAITLDKGLTQVKIQAIKIAANEVAELKGISLKRK